MTARSYSDQRPNAWETRHDAFDVLSPHRHAQAYIAIVLDGAYEERSVDGRFTCSAGDVVLHPTHHAHTNVFGSRDGHVLNISMSPIGSPPNEYRIVPGLDVIELERLARRDAVAAVQAVLEADRSKQPRGGPPWLQTLASRLAENPDGEPIGALAHLALGAACAETSIEPSAVTMATVYSHALTGDVKQALAALQQIPPASLDEEEQQKRACLLERFQHGEAPAVAADDPFVVELVRVYQSYWKKVLLGELEHDAATSHLAAGLRALMDRHSVDTTGREDLDALVEVVGSALEARGHRSIRGVTKPYWELMVWQTEEARTYPVELPETEVDVTVVFLDDFVVLGWADFATCGRHHSGGWAEEDALYCVRRAYDLDSERFTVSYLTHEAQHFADYEQFPKLESPELEYRAKLAELATARETVHRLFAAFAGRTGDSRAVPHHLANTWVVADVAHTLLGNERVDARRVESVPPERINAAARRLLQASTRQLRSRGAATVTRMSRGVPAGE